MHIDGTERPNPAPLSDASAEGVLLPAIARLGMPTLLFGVVFFLLVFGLTFLMTPDRFPVHLGEKAVRLSDLEEEQRSLEKKRGDLQVLRSSLGLEEKAPILQKVATLRKVIVPAGRALLLIDDVRAGFKTPSTDPISFPRIEVRGKEGTITIGGNISDIGGRSMQMLASFVDGLRGIPLVASVTEPEYVSIPLRGGGTVSPFVLTLTLHHE